MEEKDIRNSVSFHEKSHMLYDIIYRTKDINTIIDKASLIFENSLILSDNSFSVIACTSFVDSYNLTLDDDLWEFISEKRYYPPEYIDYALDNRLSGRLSPSHTGISKDEGYKARYYSRKIYVDEKNVGFVTLVEHKRPISEEDTYLLSEFTHVLKVALERSHMKKESSDEKYRYVISELLTSKPDSGRLKNRLSYAGIKPLSYLNVIVFKKMSLDRDLSVEYLLKITDRYVSGGKGVVFGEDTAAYIAMRNELEGNVITDRDGLFNLLKKHGLAMGISYTYKNIGNSSLHVEEAISSIEVGHPMDPHCLIYDYEKYCVFAAINRNILQEECMSLVNPRIGLVREYDRMHGTDYYNTLKAYIESDLSMSLTAKRLNLHRNTVDYRITRLRDSFGIDPDNGMLAMGYRLSFYLFDTVK